MKFFFLYALVALSSVTTQNTSMPAKECLAKCDQSNALWVTCAAECVGVPHPTNKDVQETKDCFNKCSKNDGNCQNNCIKTHFIGNNSDNQSPDNSNASPIISGSRTIAKPTGTNGSSTNISSQTTTTGASDIATSTGANRSPSVTAQNGSIKNDVSIVAIGMLMGSLVWTQS
ncbi:hypothetical protein K7432_008354 [Basidiobolus ranarum]|uniref:Uncharacterized protein n=1 Tax=Basidiobolus ranarum TaxID=34480 RepID=A0ABR2VYR1_9FUNG